MKKNILIVDDDKRLRELLKDYLTEKVIFEKNFYSFSSYRVQDEYSETKKLENKTIENLINKIYQDLLIKMSETINPK